MTLVELQQNMRKFAEDDKKNRHVMVNAETLVEAIRKAAIELSTTSERLEYETVQQGNAGVFGLGKKPWIIMAYAEIKRVETVKEEAGDSFDFSQTGAGKDGQAYVRKAADGVFLKVTAPEGDGNRVREQEALHLLEQRTLGDLNTGMISKIVKHADGEWVKVAEFDHDPSEDSQISVELGDMEMKAYIRIKRAGLHGADPTVERIRAVLELNGVLEGYLEDEMTKIEDSPAYDESLVVAEGITPKSGADGKVVYTFETENKIRLKEIDGRVDFKELNNINNVVEGQVLAKILPPEKGIAGKTVTGKYLPTKDGKSTTLLVGNNVKLSSDGRQAIAAANGQVLIQGGKISVEPIYLVEGDVNLKTGNILFLGSVEVMGNVEDGFNVKAAGNIEIHGSVGRCEIDAEGDVIVHNGITGRGEGKVLAGGNIWSKFIENANAEAGGIVVVNEGIVNSHIVCDHKIICRGKRANVVGGRLTASEEIDAKILGSVAGAETILEVGYDPKTKEQLDAIDLKIKTFEKELLDIDLNLGSMDKQVKAKKELTPEKKSYYDNLAARQGQLKTEMQDLKEEQNRLNQHLDELRNNGRISASDKVYPGVKVFIKDAYLEVRNDFKRVTFMVENGVVKVTKYEESEQDISIPKGVAPARKK